MKKILLIPIFLTLSGCAELVAIQLVTSVAGAAVDYAKENNIDKLISTECSNKYSTMTLSEICDIYWNNKDQSCWTEVHKTIVERNMDPYSQVCKGSTSKQSSFANANQSSTCTNKYDITSTPNLCKIVWDTQDPKCNSDILSILYKREIDAFGEECKNGYPTPQPIKTIPKWIDNNIVNPTANACIDKYDITSTPNLCKIVWDTQDPKCNSDILSILHKRDIDPFGEECKTGIKQLPSKPSGIAMPKRKSEKTPSR